MENVKINFVDVFDCEKTISVTSIDGEVWFCIQDNKGFKQILLNKETATLLKNLLTEML